MASEDLRSAVELLLADFSVFSHQLGGLEFYGHSTEFQELLRLCRDFSSPSASQIPTIPKAYVFLDAFHGKSSLARAITSQATVEGRQASRFDGTVGATSKELKDLQRRSDVLVVVDGVPEASPARLALIERFNALSGQAILFARSDYVADASLKADIPVFMLPNIDRRRLDKVAWILGLVGERLRDESGSIPLAFTEALHRIPLGALVTLCGVPLGSKIAILGVLAAMIGQAIHLRAGLGGELAISEEELAAIFVEFHASGAAPTSPGFRLWVEGESDYRLLKLVSRLANAAHGINLEEGLTIVPLGKGRDGGTSKATETVVGSGTRRNRDIFLFDSDEPGRHAAEELAILDQEVLLLDSKIACSRVGGDVEVEDFVSVGCLDRFYEANQHLRPEMEVIKFKPPISRRLIIDGLHKELLTEWLEANAKLEDLENLLFILCEARSRFSLRNLPAMKDKPGWRKRLVDEVDHNKHFGNRPAHWVSQEAR